MGKVVLAGIPVLVVVAFAIVSTHIAPPTAPFSASDTSELSSAGTEVTVTGLLRFAFETPACYPTCMIASVAFPYIVADGQNYRLLGTVVSSRCVNEEVTVTGWLKVPSEWASGMFTPTIFFTGDLTVVSLTVANANPTQTC